MRQPVPLNGMATALQPISEVPDQALAAWLAARREPSFRLRQIRRHIARGSGPGWEALTDLPAGLRAAFAQEFRWTAVTSVTEQGSADGETRKALLSLRDGHRIEAVLMPHNGDRNSACVSPQAGCPMACAFCATGQMGLIRNLSAGEIVDQVRHWQRELTGAGERVSHVVFMGMGEPFNNYEATVAATRTLMDRESFGISPRRITISTCGVVPKIDALAGEGLAVNLAISLHAPDDPTRLAIMPINRRWGVEEVLAAAARYVKRTKRRVTFEYILLAGVNDSAGTARLLGERITAHLRPREAHVTLIPYNPGPGGFRRPTAERMERFAETLRGCRIAATVRISKGQDIAAACGQLKVLEGRLAETTPV
ncbi:23S rRNA (adenine(2503)-C(2))-methyltransferase RlmN [soil metagenome]